MIANYKNAAGHEIGTKMNYSKLDYRMNAQLVGKVDLGDHSLGMKLYSTGVANFLFGWKQNSATTAHIGTELNLTDFAKGKLTKCPLAFQFDVNY